MKQIYKNLDIAYWVVPMPCYNTYDFYEKAGDAWEMAERTGSYAFKATIRELHKEVESKCVEVVEDSFSTKHYLFCAIDGEYSVTETVYFDDEWAAEFVTTYSSREEWLDEFAKTLSVGKLL